MAHPTDSQPTPMLTPPRTDADVDLEELQLDHEYTVIVVTASKYKAKLLDKMLAYERKAAAIKKRMVNIDAFLTRAPRS